MPGRRCAQDPVRAACGCVPQLWQLKGSQTTARYLRPQLHRQHHSSCLRLAEVQGARTRPCALLQKLPLSALLPASLAALVWPSTEKNRSVRWAVYSGPLRMSARWVESCPGRVRVTALAVHCDRGTEYAVQVHDICASPS